MFTLTTLEFLSPPTDIVHQVQAEIAVAFQKDSPSHPEPTATAFTSDFATQSTTVSAGLPQSAARVALSPGFRSTSSERTYSTLSDGLADPQVTKQAYDDIRALAASVRSARGSFQAVETMVNDIDMLYRLTGPTWVPEAGFPGRGSQLMPKWAKIVQNFEGALQASVQVAPIAISAMDGVKDLLGSAPGKTHGELKSRLQAFIAKLKVDEAQALEVKSQFQDVVDQLRTFWVHVEVALANPMVTAVRHAVLRSLAARVAGLTKELERGRDLLSWRNRVPILMRDPQLAALNTAVVSEAAAGGVGAAMTFCQLCPSAFFLLMNRTVGAGSVGNILNTTVQEIEAVKTHTASIKREMTHEQRQQVILQDPKGHLNEVALKLDTVVNIWQTINLDMHALNTDLSSNVANDAPVTVFLVAKMKVAKEIYEKLGWLLECYVEQMESL